jgi:hypothetical protein
VTVTFTVIIVGSAALQLASVGSAPDLGIALIRVMLTLIGTVAAVASSLIYDRVTRSRRR